jgi:hypothetical protein
MFWGVGLIFFVETGGDYPLLVILLIKNGVFTKQKKKELIPYKRVQPKFQVDHIFFPGPMNHQ